MIYASVLAGGVGSRMKTAKVPKQFLPLNEKPIIIHTIEKLLSVERIDKLIIAIHPQWKTHLEKELSQFEINMTDIEIISGGETRLDTINNVVNAIENGNGIDNDDIMIFHDAVRPFISEETLNASIVAATKYGGAVASYPAVDTMLYSEDGKVVLSIPERKNLFNGQAPDTFNLKLFKKALASLSDTEQNTITGTAQIAVIKGIDVQMVPSGPGNMKITTDEDYLIAQELIKEL